MAPQGAKPKDNSEARSRVWPARLPTHFSEEANGYAFLKLYQRTQHSIWLERARAFAMTAIAQCREAGHEYGRGRYSLWTGDVGLAIYLWDCLTGLPRFPTVDVF